MWVQVGNETANGLLWEVGQADKNPAQYAGIIKAGYNAVKSVCPDSKVIVHIDRGHNRSLQKWNLDLLRQHGATWDITGLSLYPYDAYGCWELGNDGQKISVDEAIKRCKYWNDCGHPDYKVNVNISYVMKTKDCTYWSQEEIGKYGFQVIQFDITE